jgi:hypothetical protein
VSVATRARAETLDTEPCRTCDGTGRLKKDNDPVDVCENCYGSGRIFVGRRKPPAVLEPSEMVRIAYNGVAEQTRIELRSRDASGNEVVTDIPCSGFSLVATPDGAKLLMMFDSSMFELVADASLSPELAQAMLEAARKLGAR